MVTTSQALASLTDDSLFERLATAVLREAVPDYHALTHTGVNAAGKTIKSPLDGICFMPGREPPHMIAAHHTTTARDVLERKWLHDPSTRSARSHRGVPAGDLIKTAEIVAAQRLLTPNLRATLILTTNQEPTVELVLAVEQVARQRHIEVDLWSRSRLSHFLDNNPAGQWIRYSFLGINQELLSVELLRQLCETNVATRRPPGAPATWVSRELDQRLMVSLRRDVIFVLAGSGFGKTVACFRQVAAHVAAGGFGLVLTHSEAEAATTLDQAIGATLRTLHPSLAVSGPTAMSLCSNEQPLIVLIEDINRSDRPQVLVEKIAGWSRTANPGANGNAHSNWRILCPLWPEHLASLGDLAQQRIQPLITMATRFRGNEGRDAVCARAKQDGQTVSLLNAEEVARALGDDPLLIALHDLSCLADPHQTIGRYVEGALQRTALTANEGTAGDYLDALRALGAQILTNRQLEPTWREVAHWAALAGESLRLLRGLTSRAEIIQLAGPAHGERISFRHDRVRDWVLADAIATLDRNGALQEQTVADPYLAEILGMALARMTPSDALLAQVATLNPLALFHALRLISAEGAMCTRIRQAIHSWLDEASTHAISKVHLRWEALRVLSETDHAGVPAIVRKFKDQTTSGQLAKLRNGDLLGGLELCVDLEPGVGAPWRDAQVDHAKSRFASSLVLDLSAFLARRSLPGIAKTAALRLAGHLADARLGPSLETCWLADGERVDRLADYLWACCQCCASDPNRFLQPICDAWASLPDDRDGPTISKRASIAAHELHWAFQRWPPVYAMDYLVQRGADDALRSPITSLLHGIDDERAVLFVTQELAALRRRIAGTDSYSHFLLIAADDWKRACEEGRPMSRTSRDALAMLWLDDSNDRHLQTQAFEFWEASQESTDVELLRTANAPATLSDPVLGARLARGDRDAIPAMMQRIRDDDSDFWWQYGRKLWSTELTELLDETLAKRGLTAQRSWFELLEIDRRAHELLQRLPEPCAERLLLKHWTHLRFSPHFVQAALYVATPLLLDAVRDVVLECPNPAELFEHLSMHLGISFKDHPGLTHEGQVRALKPYLSHVNPMGIYSIWRECNRRGWFQVRREVLDAHLQEPFRERGWPIRRIEERLDAIAGKRSAAWSATRLVNDLLATDTQWEELYAALIVWLESRRSIEALEVVAAVLQQHGSREDLREFEKYSSLPDSRAADVVDDTRFAVFRRTPR